MLETEATLEVQHLIAEFKPGDGDLLSTLHKIQDRYGYIPPLAIPVVARHLRLTPAHVFGMISFYVELRTTPPPEVTIGWCSGPACRLKGSDNIRLALEATLGIRLGESTPDNKVGLHEAQCDGSCRFSPMLWVDGKVHGPLTVSDAIRLARELSAKGKPPRRGKSRKDKA